ncbi:hypothetical protein B0T16DRAFT_224830 [Cercophora newfieldiana]|uniref:C2H2-type domain-containing protein n=1 Tax=Cercophora newfieldiana TaxID=92897 RepID=A0AA40CLQ9_9PEZI|nr:hypothetical protein B0T16DRAFT_224830 [Cercophora newfieldiana]
MADSRRFTSFFRALRERRTQSLPVMSKRLTAGLKSILTRKTDKRGLDMDMLDQDGASDGSLVEPSAPPSQDERPAKESVAGVGRNPTLNNETNHTIPARSHSTATPRGSEKRKYSGEHDDTLLTERCLYSTEAATPPTNVSRKPSTKKQQEIIDWVNQQPAVDQFSAQTPDETLPLVREDGRADVSLDITQKDETQQNDDPRVFSTPSGRTSPRKSHHSRISQDPKNRVIRESQHDQFAPVSRRGTFESQRGIYAFQMPSTTSITDQFYLSRRDSEATVGTTISGTVSDGISNKRLSASTIATTLTMAASSDTLHGQFKRLRPDSRSSSYRSGSIPSVRSSAHASNPHSLRQKVLPSAPRDSTQTPEVFHPPIPAIPQQVSTCQVGAVHSPLPLPPKSVLEAGVLAQQRRGRNSDSNPGTPTRAEFGEEPRICVPPETGDDILSVINEHASDAGSTMRASPRPSVDHRPETQEFLIDGLGNRQPSEGPSSLFSRDASPLESITSVTSLGDLLEGERPSQESSDAEDTMSDVTDHTDLSLIEVFETSQTPFDPGLLSVLMSLKEEVVDRIKQRLQTIMLQEHGFQQHPTQHNTSGSTQSEASSGSAEKATSLSALPTLRKRALDEGDDNSPGRENGDDGGRRKRKDTTTRAQLEAHLRKLACPFHKRYPSNAKLSKSCHGPGWGSVHRVKEHIYRRHGPLSRCTRCLDTFASEEKLTEHMRAEARCENRMAPPDEETINISKSQGLELRKRKKEVSEEERWFNTFHILFPDVPPDQFPSPYHESSLQVPSDPDMLSDFRTFLRRALPERIISDVNNHLRVQPPGFILPENTAELISRTLQEVMDRYRPVLLPESPEATKSADASPLFVEASTHQEPAERPGGVQTLNTYTGLNTGQVIPPPPRAAPPAPPPSTWGVVPLSDSPSTSTFDFGFSNMNQAQSAPVVEAPAVSYYAGDEMTESWVADGGYDGVGWSYGEYLEGTGP